MIREAGAGNVDAVVALGGEDVRARTLRLIEHGGINAHDFVLVSGDPIQGAVLMVVEKDEQTAEAWLYGTWSECDGLASHLRERLPGYVLDIVVEPGEVGASFAQALNAELLEELAQYTHPLPAGDAHDDIVAVTEGPALDEILAAHARAIPEAYWDDTRLRERLDQFIVLHDTVKFGYAIIARWNHEVYFFEPGHGRAEALLDACLHAASGMGAEELMVTAEPHQQDYRRLFTEAGFTLDKETAAYRAQL